MVTGEPRLGQDDHAPDRDRSGVSMTTTAATTAATPSAVAGSAPAPAPVTADIHLERVVWYREPHLRRLYGLSVFLLVASATTGYDGMMVNTSQQMDSWKAFMGKYAADPQWLGLLINSFNIGSVVSLLATPYVADTLGRRPAIAAGCVCMILGAGLSGFSRSYGTYVAGRFALGFGNALSQVASPMLLTEICHPQHRGPVTAMYNCLWNLGSLVVAFVGWGTSAFAGDWPWRLITLLQALPSVIQLGGIWFVPESPRFLVSRGRADEALAVLARYHAAGDETDPAVQLQFAEISHVLGAEQAAAASVTYLDFVRTAGNQWRLAIVVSLGVISQYSGNALFSNYLDMIWTGAGITSQNQKLAISSGKTILDLLVSVGAALAVDRVGRRPLFLFAISGMVVSFMLWTLVGALFENSAGTNQALGHAQIPLVWLFGIFYDIGFSGLLVAYTLEVLPYHLRAKGMMIMNLTVQAVLALGNQTNKLAWERLPQHWNLMLLYTLWDLVELVFVYFFYVETKGPTLEEVGRIFDGDETTTSAGEVDAERRFEGEAWEMKARFRPQSIEGVGS